MLLTEARDPAEQVSPAFDKFVLRVSYAADVAELLG